MQTTVHQRHVIRGSDPAAAMARALYSILGVAEMNAMMAMIAR